MPRGKTSPRPGMMQAHHHRQVMAFDVDRAVAKKLMTIAQATGYNNWNRLAADVLKRFADGWKTDE